MRRVIGESNHRNQVETCMTIPWKSVARTAWQRHEEDWPKRTNISGTRICRVLSTLFWGLQVKIVQFSTDRWYGWLMHVCVCKDITDICGFGAQYVPKSIPMPIYLIAEVAAKFCFTFQECRDRVRKSLQAAIESAGTRKFIILTSRNDFDDLCSVAASLMY